MKLNLSERVRANSEAAPWVIDEIKTLEKELERLRAEVQRLDIANTHSCHDDCQKLPCVQRREIERLRAELKVAYGLMLLTKNAS